MTPSRFYFIVSLGIITSFLILPFISAEGGIIYDNNRVPIIRPDEPLGPGPTGNTTGNVTCSSLNSWCLDGSSSPPTADWGMGLFGFYNVGDTTFNESVLISGAGGGFSGLLQVETTEGGRGVVIDGEVTDGLLCEGYTDTTIPGLVNSFCAQSNTLVTPSLNNRTWWSYGSAPFLNGTSLMNEYIGFLSNPVSRDFAGLSFRCTIRTLSLFEAGAGVWNGGNVTNLAYYKGTPIPKSGGNWTNLYGLWLPDMSDGVVNNYAIKTGLGLTSLNGITNITLDGNITSRKLFIDTIDLRDTVETTCNTNTEGTIYYNATVGIKSWYGCNSTTWVRLNN